MDYEYALKYPARGDWTERLLLGSGLLIASGLVALFGYLTLFFGIGLVILPLALAPRLVVDGYYLRILRRTSHGDPEPPSFSDPVALVVDGVKALAVKFVYSLPVTVPAVLGFVLAFGAMAATPESEAGEWLFLLTMYVGMPVLGLAGIVVRYFAAAGLANFAYEDDVWAAFDLGTVKEISLDSTWLIAWVVAWGVTLAAGTLALGGIGYLLLVGFVVEFYAAAVAHHVYGQAVAEVRGDGFEADGDGPSRRAGPPRSDKPSWGSIDDSGPGSAVED